MWENIDEFNKQLGLSDNQSLEIKKYIKELLVNALRSMKEEYNSEIDSAIKDLESVKIEDGK